MFLTNEFLRGNFLERGARVREWTTFAHDSETVWGQRRRPPFPSILSLVPGPRTTLRNLRVPAEHQRF